MASVSRSALFAAALVGGASAFSAPALGLARRAPIVCGASAFPPPPPTLARAAPARAHAGARTARMGLMDAFKKAFANEEFSDRAAKASHILFKGGDAADAANAVLARIEAGDISFADAARQYSECPSRSRGGSLGQFEPGQMVREFDAVVFDPATAIGEIRTVETQFGTHLVRVDARSG